MKEVFYDVEKVVAETEDMCRKTIALARGRANTPEAHRLVDLQEKLVQAVLIFDRALIEAKNAGVEPYIVGQAATSPVVYLMNGLRNNFPADAYSNFAACLVQMMMDERAGRETEGLSSGVVVSAPMQGGSA